MKKYQKLTLQILVFGFFMLCFCAMPIKAEAAAEYKEIFADDIEDDKPIKSGNYYFKRSYTDHGYIMYISQSKTGNYKETPIQEYPSFFSNGKRAYYIKYIESDEFFALYKYVFASGEETYLKKLPMEHGRDFESYYIDAIYDNEIYIGRWNEYDSYYHTYLYDPDTKKLSIAKKNCEIFGRQGKYVVTENTFRQDTSAVPISLYKLTPSGLKKVKTLTNCGFGTFTKFIGKKLFYISYPDKSASKQVVLYKCNPDGSNRKKLGTINQIGMDGQLLLESMTAKNCTLWMNGARYRYTYATKKLTKIG